jgi:hypothetical protein
MIARDAQPVGHRPPYKRVDLARWRARRPAAITLADAEASGTVPDPEFYDFIYGFGWVLRRLS